jgi:hypothetical protein
MSRTWRQRYEQRRAAEQQQADDRREIWRICLHESAHCAAVHLLGGEIERVAVGWGVLDDSLSLSGGCFWRMGGGEKIPPSIQLCVALAGPASDVFFCGRQEAMYAGDGRAAWAAAAEMAETTGRDACDISRAARLEARELVAQHAAAIEVLARELMQAPSHTLTGDRVERILEASGVRRGEAHNHQDIKRRSSTTTREHHFETAVVMRRCDGWVR